MNWLVFKKNYEPWATIYLYLSLLYARNFWYIVSYTFLNNTITILVSQSWHSLPSGFTKILLVYNKCEARFLAKSRSNFNIICSTFLKIEQQDCSISFYPVFSLSRNEKTKNLQDSEVPCKKIRATFSMAFSIKVTTTIISKKKKANK